LRLAEHFLGSHADQIAQALVVLCVPSLHTCIAVGLLLLNEGLTHPSYMCALAIAYKAVAVHMLSAKSAEIAKARVISTWVDSLGGSSALLSAVASTVTSSGGIAPASLA
jgi:hypothetical protein